MIVQVELDVHERTVLWVLDAVGSPMLPASLAARCGSAGQRLTFILLLLRRLGLVVLVDGFVSLTPEGVKIAEEAAGEASAALTVQPT